jgi:GT2 family glycosyltransferase
MTRSAVIVLNWNGLAFLPECLTSLASLTHPRECYEIILADNGSTDGSVDYVRTHFPAVEIMELGRNLGFTGGNNAAMRRALERGFDYVVLLNQDTKTDPDWLTGLVEAADSDQQIGAVQSLVLLHDRPDTVNTSGNPVHFVGFGYCGDLGRQASSVFPNEAPLVVDIPSPSGSSVLFRAGALRTAGLFDETFFAYNEDVDLGWRLRLAGYRIVVAPRSRVYHRYEFKRHPSKFYWLERNRWKTLLKNYRLPTLIVLGPALLAFELMMIAYAVMNGWLGSKLRANWDLLRHAPEIWRQRQEVQRLRRAPDRAIVRNFTGTLDMEPVNSPVVSLGNRLLEAYWSVIKHFIVW